MRMAGVGYIVFAVTMIALGIGCLITGRFESLWQPLDLSRPASETLPYLCAFVTLACGIGLLWRRVEAALVLLLYFLAWLLIYRAPDFFNGSPDPWYGSLECAVYIAATWTLFAQFAISWTVPSFFKFATGATGIRIARVLYALAMIYFGIGHFRYFNETVVLVPAWLPAHTAWAAFTGGAYVAAGVAMLIGVWARTAAALSTLQMGLLTLLVWLPALLAGPNAFQISESVDSWVLTASGWVLVDAYRNMPWLAVGKR